MTKMVRAARVLYVCVHHHLPHHGTLITDTGFTNLNQR